MTRRRRIILRIAAGLTAFVLLLAAGVYFVLQSDWFFDQVRRRIVATVETATGGRVEIGSFHFDRAHFTARVNEFVLHGTEPATGPPLFRASSVTVGLKLISLLKAMEHASARDRRAGRPAYDFGWMWEELGLDRPG